MKNPKARTDTSKIPLLDQLKRVADHAYDHDMLDARQICGDVTEFFIMLMDEVARLEKRLSAVTTDVSGKAA